MTRNVNYDKKIRANNEIVKAHKASHENELLVNKSTKCGCFCCGKIFDSSEIIEWTIDRNGDTALCPYCGIDSVLPDSAGYPLTEEFLVKMHKRWFGKLPMG